VSKKFGEWYRKTNKTEDTNKLTLLAFKIIAILHNTLLATFIKLLETVSKVYRTPLIWRPQAPDQGSTVGGLLYVSPSEEHHEWCTFCSRGGNPRTCDSDSAIDF
jgi:hypothetical protein